MSDDGCPPAVVAPTASARVAAAVTAPRGDRNRPQTVGRRKEAIVRVRLLPGTGRLTINGRTLEAYFPNKVHQQLVREPLVITEHAEAFDVVANLRGGGITGQPARCASPSPARSSTSTRTTARR